jgi:hypothetical protein
VATAARTAQLTVTLKTPHDEQRRFIESKAKRKVIKAGRRSGKTTGMGMVAIDGFLAEHRVIYAAPTQDQTDKFWFEITSALQEPVEAGLYKQNMTRRYVERPLSQNRIRAKTAWDSNSMRGDFGDLIILDEYQAMDPATLERVVYPMLLDTDGTLVVIYTPNDEDTKGMHAQDLYDEAERRMNVSLANGEQPRWEVFSFSSHDNPYLSKVALEEITEDMDELAYRQEILAEHLKENPGALWTRELIAKTRLKECPDLGYVIVAVDPAVGPGETGIVIGGRRQMDDGKMHAFITADHTMKGKPGQWGNRVATVYERHMADKVIGEVNNGGDLVENNIKVVDSTIPFKQVRASRGKAVRAEPVQSLYVEGRVHHVGVFEDLENQMCQWVPGRGTSPDRVDALVWCVTDLLLGARGWSRGATG